LRVVLRYLRSRGYNVLDPETIPIPQRNHKVPNFITSEEVTRLIAATSNLRNKAIVSLLYSSGIRVSELCALDRTDIHDDNTFTVVGKGGKARLCFIDKRTANLLSKYLTQRTDNNPSLFVGKYDTHRITSGNVQEIFRYLRKNSGIQCTPHTMRHSFATNLLRNNANMRYVQVMLGHESLQTTQMYSHVTDPDLQRIYAQYHTI
jgi:site-specific recombinase XerD